MKIKDTTKRMEKCIENILVALDEGKIHVPDSIYKAAVESLADLNTKEVDKEEYRIDFIKLIPSLEITDTYETTIQVDKEKLSVTLNLSENGYLYVRDTLVASGTACVHLEDAPIDARDDLRLLKSLVYNVRSKTCVTRALNSENDTINLCSNVIFTQVRRVAPIPATRMRQTRMRPSGVRVVRIPIS